jgi:hypothetical protein
VSAGEADVGVEGGGEAAQEGMVGSVPPSSMRSMSSSVREARTASSATVRPRAVRMSYRALPNARASRIAIRSGSSAASWGHAQRVW